MTAVHDHRTGPGAAADPLTDLCTGLLANLGPGHPLAAEVADVRASFEEPVRVAVVGRVSSGKSTLVNALVGRRVAATAAQDCTRYPVVYRAGAPEGAHAVTVDGDRVPVSVEAALGGAEVAPGHAVVRIEVTLQSAVLDAVTIVDTPGLASTSPHPLVGEEARSLAAAADVLLYLFRGIVRSDDAAVVGELRAAVGTEPDHARDDGPACTVGLLAHADNHGSGGWGDDDPMEHAATAAAGTAAALPEAFTEVLAISGLMAESVRTGAVTEADSRLLRQLREVPAALLRFGASTGAAGVEAATLTRLTQVLTPYGLNAGRAHSATSAELTAWLEEASGVRGLEEALRRGTARIRNTRTLRALERLTALTRRAGCPEEVARQVEAFAHGPAAHVVREVRAERLLAREEPTSPLLPELRRWLAHPSTDARLGAVPPDADPVAWAYGQASRFQAVSGTARTGAEAEAARTLAQSMLHLGQAAGRAGR